MRIDIVTDLNTLDAKQWNQLICKRHPFQRHEFLAGLEKTQCVSEATGWVPQHLIAYDEKQHIVGALPCYLKHHSYGEYIFDWAWADAYQRAGMNYYPKLLSAIPFTPVTANKWLLLDDKQRAESIQQLLIEKLISQADTLKLSSVHCLFTSQSNNQALKQHDFLKRVSSQFHWQNHDYADFDDFLTALSSKKRKNIKRERRRVKEANIRYQWFTGKALSDEVMNIMHTFYQRTIRRYGAQQYLNAKFFSHLQESMPDQTHVLLAYSDNTPIAGGLYFNSDNSLYGRYWGALDDYHSLHFETCYYQAIDYCIALGLHFFEAGAQGEHKLARGLLPQTTYSMHWLADPQFQKAVVDYTQQEAQQIERYNSLLNQHSPFREI